MSDKIAVVTGGGKGIGSQISLTLAKAGYDIAVNYRQSEKGADSVCREIRNMGRQALMVQADISRTDDIERMFDTIAKEFGGVDLLINNAGVTRHVPFLETDEQLFQSVVNIDFKGAYFCSQRAAKMMIEQGKGGVIINITSNQQDGCWPMSSVYGPTKAALMKFTKHAALELARYDIRVNAIAPGYTVANASRQKAEQGPVSKVPLKRAGDYHGVADAVVFLASDKADYITGTCLAIDGGALLPVAAEHSLG